jgi:microsomal dipeptidase-like Zn-dependent dipeptidase
MKWLSQLPALLAISLLLSGCDLISAEVEKTMNGVVPHLDYAIAPEAQHLHQRLIIGDWHADTTLWERDIAERGDTGHGDLVRYLEGNVALQMFTTVTKSPAGQNYHHNSADAFDNITALAIAQGWPMRSWNNLTQRALYQADKLQQLANQQPQRFMLVRNQRELQQLLDKREQGQTILGGLVGTEGSHALEGDLANIQLLYDAGFRMMSLQHFFDNQLGGSLHGRSNTGLSEFGRQAIREMERLGIMIDVSHSSEQVVQDVLELTDTPLIVSHTGLQGHCNSERNISDKLMHRIAEGGGIIGIGYWDAAVCEVTPRSIVKAISYGIDLLGLEHISLGSDFDGAVVTPFDASELAVLTDEMMKAGYSTEAIQAVMGGNMVRFLQQQLPNH